MKATIEKESEGNEKDAETSQSCKARARLLRKNLQNNRARVARNRHADLRSATKCEYHVVSNSDRKYDKHSGGGHKLLPLELRNGSAESRKMGILHPQPQPTVRLVILRGNGSRFIRHSRRMDIRTRLDPKVRENPENTRKRRTWMSPIRWSNYENTLRSTERTRLPCLGKMMNFDYQMMRATDAFSWVLAPLELVFFFSSFFFFKRSLT